MLFSNKVVKGDPKINQFANLFSGLRCRRETSLCPELPVRRNRSGRLFLGRRRQQAQPQRQGRPFSTDGHKVIYFINILLAAFIRADPKTPKSIKIQSICQYLLASFGTSRVKASHKMLMK